MAAKSSSSKIASAKAVAIKTSKTKWRDVILVCKKCQKKLDGGFGPKDDLTLKKALRRYMQAGKGRKSDLAIKSTDCFDVCPKGAVVAVNGARPQDLLVVPAGADLLEVKARLGLEDGRRLKPPLLLAAPLPAPNGDADPSTDAEVIPAM